MPSIRMCKRHGAIASASALGYGGPLAPGYCCPVGRRLELEARERRLRWASEYDPSEGAPEAARRREEWSCRYVP